MQDKHNIVFVLRPFLFAFCFTLSGFYIFSLTFLPRLTPITIVPACSLTTTNTLNFGCILFDFRFKFKMRAESFLPDTITEFNFTLTASPKFLPTA
jgi:hypothetical protein